MNAMKDAIRARRSGGLMDEGSVAPQSQASGVDIEALVASLSDLDRQKLMALLSGEVGESATASQIEKGQPSDTERQIINQKMQEDNEPDADDGSISEDESDDIAMSMLDNKHKSADLSEGARPLNLGDRAKMRMAKNLRAKGKL